MRDGVPALVVPFELRPTARSAPRTATVVARARVVLEDGSVEVDPPYGADTPQILSWRNSNGPRIESGDQASIPVDANGTWSVAVSVPRDAAVEVELAIADGAEA
jgi:hypothetical protein